MSNILKTMISACKKYNLIENNDKVAVGLSGGKDSISMLNLLLDYKKYSDIDFELEAISVDMFNGNGDLSALIEFCEKNKIKLHIEKTQIFDVIFNIRKEKNPCSLCAKMRNGVLHNKAKKLGCNKVALGHHADDLIETFFLSMLYENRLSIFKPSSYLDRTDITIIRPMISLFEYQLIDYHKSNSLPLINNPCPADKNTKRESVKKHLKQVNTIFPNSKKSIYEAIINKDRYNLL